MAALPSPTQVAGHHSAIYEAYYNVVDPKGLGTVGGMEAARFLKRSGLSDVILSKIWDLSDPGGRGCLDKSGMFVALKLVALVQNGKDLTVTNVNIDVSPPKMGDIPLPKPMKPPPPTNTPLITSLPPTAVDWSVKAAEREKYDKLFDSLQPTNGLIAGNKVKNVLMESKLPFDTLGKIWDLADQDKDGMLDRYEFVAAMHLVYKALDKFAIPNSLPAELMPPVKRKNSNTMGPSILSRGLDGVKMDLPPATLISQSISAPAKPIQSVLPTDNWVVTPDEKSKSDALFIKSDIDKDGFVSGQEIKDVFLQSGVPQPILAHIWALCDIKQSGKLNNEQFALAMWFVAKCLRGMEPPTELTPEMVPPSFRPSKPADGLVENNNTRYSNPELDMVSKDIEDMSRERLILETDVAQKEAEIRIKSGEIKNLQSELDTLAATLKQLENQRGEAQKRLNDLKAQSSEKDVEIEEIIAQIEEKGVMVEKLRLQAAEQAETVASQESELTSKKELLEGLRQEEKRLENEMDEGSQTLNRLTSSLQDSQLNISQAKALLTQLEEQTRQITDAITSCDTAITTGDISHVPDTALRIHPEFRDTEYTKLGMVNGNDSKQNGFGSVSDDPFANTGGFNEGLFEDDPFKSNHTAFATTDPFNSAFSKQNDRFSSDPFGTHATTADPFDAFGDSRKTGGGSGEPNKDAFGCDPFAVLHAPTKESPAPPRPSSPSPALPPKKSKQPPPRPAPPRPNLPPVQKKASHNDPFGSDAFSSGSFADFADFDTKCLHHSFLVDLPYVPSPYPCTPNTYIPLNNPWLDTCDLSFSNKTTTAKIAGQPQKGLDFTDDPFRDYRYEDPFNICFDDEPLDNKPKAGSMDAFQTPENNNNSNDWTGSNNNNNNNQDKFDPFGLDGRQSVPLPTSNLFVSDSGRASAPIPSKQLSEDQQLAWANEESLKLEKARQQRQLQEQQDLELAISLSKAES